MLTTGGGFALLTRFSRAMSPPNVVAVSLQEASSIAAPGAVAPAHSASSAGLALSAPLTPEFGASRGGAAWPNR